MTIALEISGLGSRPYPLDRERRRRVMVVLAKRDMTISGLARSLGVSKQYISAIICGRRLSAKTEQRIADFLGKPSDDLFPRRKAGEINRMRKAEAEAKERTA